MKTNEVLENIKARRSVRAYTSQQVSEEDLLAILEAATYAPSGIQRTYTMVGWYGLCLCNRKYVSGCPFFRNRLLLDQSVGHNVR